jgi:hypothetical protein
MTLLYEFERALDVAHRPRVFGLDRSVPNRSPDVRDSVSRHPNKEVSPSSLSYLLGCQDHSMLV